MKSNASKILIISLLLVVAVSGVLGFFDIPVYAQAQSTPYYNGSYYDGVNANATGNSMLQQLRSLISSNHQNSTYNGLDTVFKKSDVDPNNSSNVINFYTGTSSSANKMFSGGVNREHVWPKRGGDSFPEKSQAGSDAHHLRPCDTELNSTRSNKGYDEIEQNTSSRVSENGSTSYGDPNNLDSYCYTNSEYFYPAEGYRGATARILLYVFTRWGAVHGLDFVENGGTTKRIGKISTLMKWHYQEPPTDAEIRRNDAVYQIQGNRNPFIDHPEWATTIICDTGASYSSNCKAVAEQYDKYDEQGSDVIQPTSLLPSAYRLDMTIGQSQALTVTALPEGASNEVTFSSKNTSVATVDANGKVTAKSDGQTEIVITSKVNTNIKAYVAVDVKKATAITVSGTPDKTTYFAGQKFDASGLTITVTYDDNSTGTLQATDCLWLDASTQAETLSQGTTSVICKYGNLTATVGGITVGQSQEQKVTITRDNVVSATNAYKWYSWKNGDVSGQVYAYFPPNAETFQFNDNQNHYYLYGETPAPIKSITVYLSSSSTKWELLTSATPFDNSSKPYPASGTNHGTKDVTTSGVTWTLDGQHKYFSLNYKGTVATYVQKIEITYDGSSGGEATPPVNDSVTLDKSTHSMQTTETFTLNATASGDVVWNSSNTNVATVSNGVVTAIGKGTATITATCGTAKATCVVTVTQKPCQTHTFGDWLVDKQPTCQTEGSRHKECTICGEKSTAEAIAKTSHTESDWKIDKQATCQQTGSKHTECTVCHQTLQTEQIPLANHVESDWLVDKQPTCKEEGSRHKECTICGQTTTPAQAIAKTENHTFGGWQTTAYPTPTANGSQTRECQACGKTETRQIEYAGEVDDFVQAVNALQNATTLQQKYQAICTAVNIYNGYSAEQKQQVESQFATLKGYVEGYNQQVSQINQTSQDALKAVVSSLCLTSVAVALWFVLKKRV